MTIDLENQLIYATRGNYSDSFSVYDINRNEWRYSFSASISKYWRSADVLRKWGLSLYAPGNGFQYMFEYVVNSGNGKEELLHHLALITVLVCMLFQIICIWFEVVTLIFL